MIGGDIVEYRMTEVYAYVTNLVKQPLDDGFAC